MAKTKRVYYDEGPLSITFGEAGTFLLGVPREVPEYLANVLLRKGVVKEMIEIKPNKEG